MLRPLLTLVSILSLAGAALAQNIYPDPGFEASGVPGVSHEGAKAGYLEVGALEHWRALGGPLKVEPYATYRATAWVKATVGQGQALALYAYQWDSFEWSFHTQVAIPSTDKWMRATVTFASPTGEVNLHPLAFLDAANGKAWVDDVSVERVKTSDQTIAELCMKSKLTDDQTRLLTRWYVERGKLGAAEKLLKPGLAPEAAADVACVIAKATTDPPQRARLLALMLRYGAPRYNDGSRRLGEVAAGLGPDVVAAALCDELRTVSGDATAIDTITQAMGALVRMTSLPECIASRKARIAGLTKTSRELVDAASAGSPEQAALRRLRAEIRKIDSGLRQEMRLMGHATIVIGGKEVLPATHAIVVAQKPSPQADLASRDLQAHIEKITGNVIPIVAAGDANGKAILAVGDSPAVRALGVKVDPAALGADGIRIKTAGPSVALVGNRRGVLYATYTFLEDYVGCRWFTPDCMTWPTNGTVIVGTIDVTYVPPLEYRATDYPNSRPAEFAVRNKLNGAQVSASEAWGGNISYRGFVHTFNSLVPPDQYFDSHPEYFSEVGGKRIRDYTQLCLTNPDVLRVATETVMRWIEESPEATIISVSQNDWANWCQCPNCTAVAQQEGSQSGPLLRFVNAIADAVAGKHPGIIIDTLAYQYTRKPPKMTKPRPNVAVRLCSIECEFNRPLATSPFNKTFVDDIKGWNVICSRLYIWDYVINYAHSVQPFPNLNVLQPNIRFFVENGVTGVYEEADYFTRGGEMAELRTYLMAKALWNPECDIQRAMDEFLAAYYGPAAPKVREYIEDIHRLAVSDPDFHMPIYVGPTGPFQTPEAIARYEAMFDEAEAAVAGDPVRLHRVQVARLPVMYTRIVRNSDPAFKLENGALVPLSGDGLLGYIDRFEKIARAEGLTMLAEGGLGANFDAWLAQMRAGAEPKPVSRISGGGLEAVVVPGLGGRILSLKRSSDGREFLQVAAKDGGINPTVGGYKEFSEAGYQSPGWIEPFALQSADARNVSLGAWLSNGLSIQRHYELDGAKPVLRVESTVTNVSADPRAACLRVHPCFRLDRGSGAKLRLGPPGAEERPFPETTSSELEWWFRGAEVPPGEWALVDTDGGVTITSRFDPAEVATCYLNWSARDRRANMELWSEQRTLQPGETIRLAHSYEVE